MCLEAGEVLPAVFLGNNGTLWSLSSFTPAFKEEPQVKEGDLCGHVSNP